MATTELPPSKPEMMPQDSKRSWWQKSYMFFGFRKGYNLPLFIILAGAMLGFSLARLPYLNLNGRFASSASPGEWYWFRAGHYRIGLLIHLGCILPAGLLMVWQFIPRIRHRAIMFHRINGYVIICLVLLSNVGALMIVRRAFGGDLSTQAGVGVLVITTTIGLAMACYNIKRLQIDQHRAWMLRTMVYLGSIITTRFILIISAQITSMIGSYNVIYTCDELSFMYGAGSELFQTKYPQCAAGNASEAVTHVDFGSGQVDDIGASLRVGFGMALWLSIFLHMAGTEIYLNLTPREAQRLREVSYERQMEAGFKNPGSAGLVVEQWGNADEWESTVRM